MKHWLKTLILENDTLHLIAVVLAEIAFCMLIFLLFLSGDKPPADTSKPPEIDRVYMEVWKDGYVVKYEYNNEIEVNKTYYKPGAYCKINLPVGWKWNQKQPDDGIRFGYSKNEVYYHDAFDDRINLPIGTTIEVIGSVSYWYWLNVGGGGCNGDHSGLLIGQPG